jgi:hypothetical protein
MAGIAAEDALELAADEGEEPVETFAADAAVGRRRGRRAAGPASLRALQIEVANPTGVALGRLALALLEPANTFAG